MEESRIPWVTVAIGLACLVNGGLAYIWGGDMYNMALWNMGANSGQAVRAGEWWRLLGSAFLHGNVIHLVVNMIALASFGPLLEQLLGGKRYLLLYALTALGGAAASALLRDGGSSVGASGAIWGLMTATIALTIWPRGVLPKAAMLGARQQLMVPLAINFFYSFQPGVDYLAHFGGGAVGFLLVASGLLLYGLPRPFAHSDLGLAHGGEPPQEVAQHAAKGNRIMTSAAVLSVAAMAASVGLSFAHGTPWHTNRVPGLVPVRVDATGFTLSLPSNIVRAPQRTEQDGLTIVGYGTLMDSPVAVETRHGPLPSAVPFDQIPAELEQLRQDVGTPQPGEELDGAATMIKLAGQDYVKVKTILTKEKIAKHAWFTTNGTSIIGVLIYVHPEASTAWRAVPEQIAATFAVAPSR